MPSHAKSRRDFLKTSIASAAALPIARSASARAAAQEAAPRPSRIRFAAIGLNHDHINGQVEAVTRGGGTLVSFYAKEPDLAAAFSKRFPDAKLAGSAQEIYEDSSIQLIVSAAIPDERAGVALEAMKHGKDVMLDKPGMTTLEQLAEVRRLQAETRRIVSILYSERHENRATVKAGELVKAGVIGKVVQTAGFGPHRMTPKTRPSCTCKPA